MSSLIGTAGWAIPANDRPSFPAEGTALERYAAVMPCLEVNSSFHRSHRRGTWERWAASVPDGFRFSAKIPKEISHVRRLVDATDALDRFLSEAGGLGGKLLVILLQLPPSFAFDVSLISSFLRAASLRTDARIVCEPRHASWFTQEADTLLVDHEVARAAADPAKVPEAAQSGGWRGISYHRLHGSPVMYRSAYGEERLRSYASEIAADLAAGRQTWCIFDNTASSAALGDALILMRLLGCASSATHPVRRASTRTERAQGSGVHRHDP
ncbi:DUF72 domain-containing protein [Sphingomonas melonis]|uniref:Uncharacterized protein YecE (DUF72 family) n=1 Tax=Sphingomonas melonis TaxID=152682 RepID=A0A7Y9FKM6_9SPHN|nr:DUF72 domain-containing protein [Sphingomonas melonis]NYD89080.1 uncharacterized protein YecE (DUF72 family) [Sphingomonas melonis]